MLEQLKSFWINILASIAFGSIVTIFAKYPLGVAFMNSLGVGILAAAILGLILYSFQRSKVDTSIKNHESTTDNSKSVSAKIISGGTIIQADNINEIHVTQLPPAKTNNEEKVSFITESIKSGQSSFCILFSIWNNTSRTIKLFDVKGIEHIRLDSVSYYGGKRHFLKLEQDRSSLWNGETYEILTNQSASFDIKYKIITGPADGEPFIVLGILVRYHDQNTTMRDLHSDAVYILDRGVIKAIPILQLRNLNNSNMFIHRIYASTLQSLSNILLTYRDYIITLMTDDYNIGFEKLRKILITYGEKDILSSVENIENALIGILQEEKTRPLDQPDLKQKNDLLEELQLISIKYCRMSFVDLCIINPELSTSN